MPADAATAVGGCWRPGPGAALFAALASTLGKDRELPIIAEDLGVVADEVRALRKHLGLPGMRILQFAFDGDVDNLYLPHNFDARTVVYTGTHDNDTTCGWWNGIAEEERDRVRRYLAVSGEAIHWDFIRAASASVADFSIVPMQDVLGLGSAQRMNRPGAATGAWEWRFAWSQVHAWHAERLRELARIYGRLGALAHGAHR